MLRYTIDLDNTISKYERGTFESNLEHIGEPIEGAQEFVRRLSEHVGNDGKKARIIIFTRRMSLETLTPHEKFMVYNSIVNWLNDNGFVWHEIYDGHGKPDGTAFIDDKGVQCRPRENPNAFEEAERYIKNVILMEKR